MKIKQSETVEVNRTQISFAVYNPRKESPEIIASIKKNFKKVGFLGGLVWNERTGNLVSGHKRLETLDIINKYDGTVKTDYKLKVEKVDLDEKTEKEQNIYMNNIEQQGEYDFQKLADLVPDIDFEAAGLTDFQLEKISVFSPDIEIEHETEKEKEELTATEKEERKEKVKEAKNTAYENTQTAHLNATQSHISIVFNDYNEKVEFCEMFGIDIETKLISSKDFIEKLEG